MSDKSASKPKLKIRSSVPAPVPAPVPASVPASVPAPVPAPVPASKTASVPASVPASKIATKSSRLNIKPRSTPSSTSSSALALVSVQTSSSTPSSTSMSTSTSSSEKYPSIYSFEFDDYINNDKFLHDIDVDENVNEKIVANLKDYQKIVINYMSYDTPYKGLLVNFDVGTGKTRTGCLIALNFIKNCKNKGKVSIICPANLQSVWKDELKKLLGTSLGSSFDAYIAQNFQFFSYNAYNSKSANWQRTKYNNGLMIIDESHTFVSAMTKVENTTHQFYKKIRDKNQFPHKILMLTATPIINTPIELAYTFNILSLEEQDIFPTTTFLDTYCDGNNIKESMIPIFQYIIKGKIAYFVSDKKSDDYPNFLGITMKYIKMGEDQAGFFNIVYLKELEMLRKNKYSSLNNDKDNVSFLTKSRIASIAVLKSDVLKSQTIIIDREVLIRDIEKVTETLLFRQYSEFANFRNSISDFDIKYIKIYFFFIVKYIYSEGSKGSKDSKVFEVFEEFLDKYKEYNVFHIFVEKSKENMHEIFKALTNFNMSNFFTYIGAMKNNPEIQKNYESFSNKVDKLDGINLEIDTNLKSEFFEIKSGLTETIDSILNEIAGLSDFLSGSLSAFDTKETKETEYKINTLDTLAELIECITDLNNQIDVIDEISNDNIKDIVSISKGLSSMLIETIESIENTESIESIENIFLLSELLNDITNSLNKFSEKLEDNISSEDIKEIENLINDSIVVTISLLSTYKDIFEQEQTEEEQEQTEEEQKEEQEFLGSVQEMTEILEDYSSEISETRDINVLLEIFNNIKKLQEKIIPIATNNKKCKIYMHEGIYPEIKEIYKANDLITEKILILESQKSTKSTKSEEIYSCKFEYLLNVLNENIKKGEKSLVYSFFSNKGIVRFASYLTSHDERYNKYNGKNDPHSYILYNGDVKSNEREALIVHYNKPENAKGQLTPIILGTGVLSEGLTIECVRHVYILEDFWNMSRIMQVIGRGNRIGTHKNLLPNDRTIDCEILSAYSGTHSMSADIHVKSIAIRKETLNKQFREIMRGVCINKGNLINVVDGVLNIFVEKPLQQKEDDSPANIKGIVNMYSKRNLFYSEYDSEKYYFMGIYLSDENSMKLIKVKTKSGSGGSDGSDGSDGGVLVVDKKLINDIEYDCYIVYSYDEYIKNHEIKAIGYLLQYEGVNSYDYIQDD